MTKAKDLANEYLNSADKIKTAKEIFIKLLDDAEELIKSRHIKTQAAFASIIKEQNRKWKAMCRLTNNELNPEGFRLLFLKQFETRWGGEEIFK